MQLDTSKRKDGRVRLGQLVAQITDKAQRHALGKILVWSSEPWSWKLGYFDQFSSRLAPNFGLIKLDYLQMVSVWDSLHGGHCYEVIKMVLFFNSTATHKSLIPMGS